MTPNPFLTPPMNWKPPTYEEFKHQLLHFTPPPQPQVYGLTYKTMYPVLGYTKAWLIDVHGRAVCKRKIPELPKKPDEVPYITFLVKEACTISHIELRGNPTGEVFSVSCGSGGGPTFVAPNSVFYFHFSWTIW